MHPDLRSRTRSPRDPSRPQGREAVRAAVLTAATRLFSRSGPAGVSLRDVAREANVNLGLIHRHFGNKRELLTGVLEHLAGRIAVAAQADATLDERVIALFDATVDSPYWRVLAHALLDGEVARDVQQSFPTVHALVAILEEAQASGELDPMFDARIVAGAMVAQSLGWLMFEPFLLAATGLDAEPFQSVRASVRATLAENVRRLAAPPARETGACFSATFDAADVARSDATLFKAKAQ